MRHFGSVSVYRYCCHVVCLARVRRSLERAGLPFHFAPSARAGLALATVILDSIRDMEESVSSGRAEPKGLLRVNATPGFGRTRIAPLVSRFAHDRPEVEVEFQLTDRPISLIEEAYDLAIRFGELPDTRLSARKLMSNKRFLCASPAYLKTAGEPQAPEELHRHRCIL